MIQSFATELLILLFLIVTFLQSGIDKAADWKGNVSFLSSHFKNSPLKNQVPLLLGIVLVTEIASSLLMIVGFFQLIFFEIKQYALIGIELAAITLIFLLIGQRLAKDYAGAMTLAVYFLLCVFGVFLLS